MTQRYVVPEEGLKAAAHVGVIVCDECGRAMLAEPKNARIQGSGYFYNHVSDDGCPNAGKKFKVATVELEEL